MTARAVVAVLGLALAPAGALASPPAARVASTTRAREPAHAPRPAAPAPALASPAAAVLDAATGDALLARNADDVRPIASLTKLFVAIALRRRHLDLDGWTTINFDDATASAGGARTMLLEGERFANRDLLYAMLLASDNRVPSALARAVGLSNPELIDRLGHLAGDLGLSHTRFDDATGIRGNASTARELALAMREAARDPLLAKIMTTRHARAVSESRTIHASYTSTVQPLWDDRYKVRAGKTGHTEAAGYCLVIVLEVGERAVVIALLGGKTPDARFADLAKLVAWLDATAP